MATLNVKQFPDDIYAKLRARAQEEHRSVSQEVLHLLSEALASEPLSILELEGLGEEAWKGIDPAEHVRRERDSWD